jgi:hypothetical protein
MSDGNLREDFISLAYIAIVRVKPPLRSHAGYVSSSIKNAIKTHIGYLNAARRKVSKFAFVEEKSVDLVAASAKSVEFYVGRAQIENLMPALKKTMHRRVI